ncbi:MULTISPECIES: hypothetical protein [Stenotrophomonas]|jgi:hypothetical protein
MTTALIAATVVISIAGFGFAAWTLIQSHKDVQRQRERDHAE